LKWRAALLASAWRIDRAAACECSLRKPLTIHGLALLPIPIFHFPGSAFLPIPHQVPLTVFAPTNEAFELALGALNVTLEDVVANTELLTNILA